MDERERQERLDHAHASLKAAVRQRETYDTLTRVYVEALILSGLLLALQFAVLAWGYADPGSVNGRLLWLNPGLACATGSTIATLHHIARRRLGKRGV